MTDNYKLTVANEIAYISEEKGITTWRITGALTSVNSISIVTI